MSLGRQRTSRRSAPAAGPAPRGAFRDKLELALEAEGFDRTIEGIASQRELAWRCADSLSLRRFLGFGPTEPTPDHSTLTLLRKRLPTPLHEQAFRLILAAARSHDVLRGRRISLAMPWGPLSAA